MTNLDAANEAIAYLRDQASGSAILVEGRKDMAALEALDIPGVHLVLNEGVGVITRVDQIVREAAELGWRQVVVLMDWDRTGDRLQRRIELTFAGRLTTNGESRRRLAAAFSCKCVELVPAELAAVQRQADNPSA